MKKILMALAMVGFACFSAEAQSSVKACGAPEGMQVSLQKKRISPATKPSMQRTSRSAKATTDILYAVKHLI